MKNVFYQVSTLNTLMLGNFDGTVSVRELLAHGSWGIGTYEGLDGEAIICDGHAYDAHADGTACEYGPDEQAAFSTVANFSDDAVELQIEDAADIEAVKAQLDAARRSYQENDNVWYLVAMHGSFPEVHVRSCQKQEKPYRTLFEVAGDQREYHYEDEQGWVIGVWVPKYMDGINMPGWHVHYLSDDKKRGGHLLGLACEKATGTMEGYDHFEMVLPENPEFAGRDLTADLAAATSKVEGAKEK